MSHEGGAQPDAILRRAKGRGRIAVGQEFAPRAFGYFRWAIALVYREGV